MKSQNKVKGLLLILAVALAMAVAAPALADPPPFTATITFDPDPATVCAGETVTIAVEWSTNRDVKSYEWSVDGEGQGVVSFDGVSSGSATFDFDAAGMDAGEHELCFHIWHDQQTDRDAEECVTVIVEECGECEWYPETAWAAGIRYVEQGNWATYTPYVADSTVTLYAGQDMEAGTVHFSAVDSGNVTITITLNESWRFNDIDENVKIQDYAVAPFGNPSPGLFDSKDYAFESPFSIDVPANNFYGVHVDVEWEDCD